ncbi:SpoIIE family protein phosphatase [Candidatus Sumerlaeota bacterium]|nr:SpoIIE family protein phosphatase [Candidatus Sumerlaeota bacterium]
MGPGTGPLGIRHVPAAGDETAIASMALSEQTAPATILLFGVGGPNRPLAVERLKGDGHNVVEARADTDLVAELDRVKPRVLICELAPHETANPDLFGRLKNDPARDPFYILATGTAEMRDDLIRALDAGADDYMLSPLHLDDLAARVRAGLRIVDLQTLLSLRNEQFRRLTSRLNQELDVVSGIQKSMLPQVIPETEGFDFTAFYWPSSECGGDYYDLVELDDNRLGFLVADVSGHGAPAMVAMALIRQAFHMFSRRYLEPGRLLEELNRLLYDHLPTNQFATMFYAVIDTKTLECRYASAGHNPPLWFQASTGEVVEIPKCQGFPLKLVSREISYSTAEVQFQPGDCVVFFTDGIPECFNREREVYGVERLREVVRKNAAQMAPRELEIAIVTDLLQFADDHPTEDDLTLAIMRFR